MAPSKYGDDVRGRVIGVDRTPLADASSTELINGNGSSDDLSTSTSEVKPAADGQNNSICASPSSDKENTSMREEVVVNGAQEKKSNGDVGSTPSTPTLSPR